MKIVIIGAGSRTFGRRSVTDILGNPAMREIAPEVVLVDTDAKNLEDALKLALMMKEHFASPSEISATTDRTEALAGADYVLISVTRKRYELWEQDFRVPYIHGFRQAYGENGGPGALFHALRNLHLIMPICEDVERLCPEAVVFNYSNPESRILLGMHMLTNLKAVGLCHGQHDALAAVSKMLGKPEAEIDILGGGINHFFWLYKITCRKSGEDLYPRVKKAAIENEDGDFSLPKKLLEIYGMLTYPDNTHAGEFVSFGADFLEGKWVHGLESRSVDLPHKSEADPTGPYLRGERPLEEIAAPSREMGVPMILAHHKNEGTRFLSGNVLNNGFYVPNLLPDGIVEVPVKVDGEGFHPETVPALPDGLAGLLRTQMAIQKLSVLAYKERSKNLILQALLLEPTVDSVAGAEALIDDMLHLQADYLPKFS